MSDLIAPVRMSRWDTGTLAWVVWDGSLTAGALTIGTVNQGTGGSSAWKVSATDLDVRDLVFATDKVDSSGSSAILTNTNRSDTYTVAANGTTVTATSSPYKAYAIQVTGTGAAATAWDVRLEGSLNGTTFTQILQHTTTTGDTVVLYSGALQAPSLYMRSRCAGITLGGATNVVAVITGIQ